jgi:hypothetical protein
MARTKNPRQRRIAQIRAKWHRRQERKKNPPPVEAEAPKQEPVAASSLAPPEPVAPEAIPTPESQAPVPEADA